MSETSIKFELEEIDNLNFTPMHREISQFTD